LSGLADGKGANSANDSWKATKRQTHPESRCRATLDGPGRLNKNDYKHENENNPKPTMTMTFLHSRHPAGEWAALTGWAFW